MRSQEEPLVQLPRDQRAVVADEFRASGRVIVDQFENPSGTPARPLAASAASASHVLIEGDRNRLHVVSTDACGANIGESTLWYF
jgi:hypothetical protein